MITNIFKKFADNTAFYNPAAGPDAPLLSVKERIKGKALPFLASVSLTALSLGLSAAAIGSGAALGIAATLTALTTVFAARSFANIEKKLAQAECYDFAKLEDALRFSKNFPAQAALPAKFIRAAAQAGVPENKIPRLYVTDGNDFWVSKLNPFGSDAHYGMSIGRKRLQKDSTEALLSGMAHETGHAVLGHSAAPSFILHAQSAPLLHIQAGATMMMTGNVLAGAIYTTAAIAFNGVTLAKRSQYNEREADRFALKTTGIVDAPADEFELFADLETLSKSNTAMHRLLSTHPASKQRADYIRDFGKANPDFCSKRRIAIGLVR